jgi:hypothetical protein
MEVGEFEFHPPGLDLRKVQDVVDQGQEMLPRGMNILRILLCFSLSSPNIFSDSTSEKPDDGVQGRPQLVGHVRQELGLVLTGRLRAGGSCPSISRKRRAFWIGQS